MPSRSQMHDSSWSDQKTPLDPRLPTFDDLPLENRDDVRVIMLQAPRPPPPRGPGGPARRPAPPPPPPPPPPPTMLKWGALPVRGANL